jgi:hypothetical protein
VRCGGNWKRDYGHFYPGTQGETLDTAKERPTSYRASSRPYHRPAGVRGTPVSPKWIRAFSIPSHRSVHGGQLIPVAIHYGRSVFLNVVVSSSITTRDLVASCLERSLGVVDDVEIGFAPQFCKRHIEQQVWKLERFGGRMAVHRNAFAGGERLLANRKGVAAVFTSHFPRQMRRRGRRGSCQPCKRSSFQPRFAGLCLPESQSVRQSPHYDP